MLLALASATRASEIQIALSAAEPASQHYSVTLRCEGLDGDPLDFRMPCWTPGYYQLMNYARHVDGFAARDGQGRALEWSKPDNDTWRVKPNGAPVTVVSYRVRAARDFVAENHLDPERGYVCPAATFMYVAGRLDHPATLTVTPYAPWPDVVTGLEPAPGEFTFTAPDFDTLYDCPLLLGDLEPLEFSAAGKPCAFVAVELGDFPREEFARDAARMIEAAAAICDDVPYERYTFMAIGPGQGGIEHANTCAISYTPREGGRSPSRNKRFMAFLAHEFFHLYNAKRVRPIELGPFDYQQENRTRMLWVAEGFTLYYEHLILHRAGLTSRDHLLEQLAGHIQRHESRPGRLVQSPAQASWNTWDEGPFGGAPETTVSCYDAGAVVGLLLDLAIRQETAGQKSLDDVMRLLYRKFYQQLGRGYTEEEFREACAQVAGAPLTEVLGYATSAGQIDYDKHLGPAGLVLERWEEDGEEQCALRVSDSITSAQRALLAGWLEGDGSPPQTAPTPAPGRASRR